jgi:hypothetical protein
MLWKEAGEHEVSTQRVFAHLIKTNNLARLEFFLELGADVEVRLPAVEVTCTGVKPIIGDEGGSNPFDIEPTPLLIAADSDNIPIVRLKSADPLDIRKPFAADKARFARVYGSGVRCPTLRFPESDPKNLQLHPKPTAKDPILCRPPRQPFIHSLTPLITPAVD